MSNKEIEALAAQNVADSTTKHRPQRKDRNSGAGELNKAQMIAKKHRTKCGQQMAKLVNIVRL